MVITLNQLLAMGAQLVGGRVLFEGAFVEGDMGDGAFTTAPGSALDAANVPSEKAAKKALADMEAAAAAMANPADPFAA